MYGPGLFVGYLFFEFEVHFQRLSPMSIRTFYMGWAFCRIGPIVSGCLWPDLRFFFAAHTFGRVHPYLDFLVSVGL